MKFIALLIFVLMPFQNNHSVHDFMMRTIDGETVPLSSYKGKVLLIVNVASKCGLTPQYEDIQRFYEEYKDQGVVVLGFPANDFMGQEPGTDEEIKTFCKTKYNVDFPMFSKITVKGKGQHPLYSYLTNKEENGVINAPVKWNFQKFLVDKDGRVIASFDPKTGVYEEKVINAVEKLIKG